MSKQRRNKGSSKSEFFQTIAEETGLDRKEVSRVFEALTAQIGKSVGKKGPGIFVVPGLMKITIKNKPATKARKGIDPFTKEERMFKAKPASRLVKIKALKNLKEMAVVGRQPRYRCNANGEYTSSPYCEEHNSDCRRVL